MIIRSIVLSFILWRTTHALFASFIFLRIMINSDLYICYNNYHTVLIYIIYHIDLVCSNIIMIHGSRTGATMTSAKASQVVNERERELRIYRNCNPSLIHYVRFSGTGYSGRRYNSTEEVYLHESWLHDNCMPEKWRRTTICAHPGEWFRVHRVARTKQTAVVKDQ